MESSNGVQSPKTFCGACCGDKEGCLSMLEIEVVKRPNSAQGNEQINFEDEKRMATLIHALKSDGKNSQKKPSGEQYRNDILPEGL